MIADVLIPARFLSTIAHLVAVVMVWATKSSNLAVSLPLMDTTLLSSYDISITFALVISVLCFCVELVGLFLGISLFNHGSNFFYTLVHTLAAISISFFILESWHYVTFWYICIFCNILPALVEVSNIISVSVLKLNQY